MKMVVQLVSLEQNIEYLSWASKKLGWQLSPEDKVWFTNFNERMEITGVAFYHSWYPTGSAQLGLVVEKHGLTKELIKETFRYGFVYLKLARISVITSSDLLKDKPTWIKQLVRMGAVYETTLLDWFGKGLNGHFLRFTPDSMRRGKFGRLIFEDIQ